MTITAMIIAALSIALVTGWAIGVIASTVAERALHLPRTSFIKLIPLAASFALAGGLTAGAWQASETLLMDQTLEDSVPICETSSECSPCGSCPGSN